MDAIKTSIALAISKKGILWRNNMVNMVLLPDLVLTSIYFHSTIGLSIISEFR